MKHASVDRAKRVSKQCQNNKQCPYCRRSRTWGSARTLAGAAIAVRDFLRRDGYACNKAEAA